MNWHVVFGFAGTFLLVGFMLCSTVAADAHNWRMPRVGRRAIAGAIACAVLASLFWGLVFV